MQRALVPMCLVAGAYAVVLACGGDRRKRQLGRRVLLLSNSDWGGAGPASGEGGLRYGFEFMCKDAQRAACALGGAEPAGTELSSPGG
jgi:hypothetical protein